MQSAVLQSLTATNTSDFVVQGKCIGRVLQALAAVTRDIVRQVDIPHAACTCPEVIPSGMPHLVCRDRSSWEHVLPAGLRKVVCQNARNACLPSQETLRDMMGTFSSSLANLSFGDGTETEDIHSKVLLWSTECVRTLHMKHEDSYPWCMEQGLSVLSKMLRAKKLYTSVWDKGPTNISCMCCYHAEVHEKTGILGDVGFDLMGFAVTPAMAKVMACKMLVDNAFEHGILDLGIKLSMLPKKFERGWAYM